MITFYIFDHTLTQASWLFAAKLMQAAYKKGETQLIVFADETKTKQFDEWLWTFDQASFIPHTLLKEGLNSSVPIYIAKADQDLPRRDIIFNFSDKLLPTTPPQQLFEIVLNEPNKHQLARERYKKYREQNFTIEVHKMKSEHYD